MIMELPISIACSRIADYTDQKLLIQGKIIVIGRKRGKEGEKKQLDI